LRRRRRGGEERTEEGGEAGHGGRDSIAVTAGHPQRYRMCSQDVAPDDAEALWLLRQ
jgi:hypothetical protein